MYRFFLTKGLFFTVLMLLLDMSAQKPTCPKTIGAELVTNGDFKSGNSGFTSGFTYNATSVTPGFYSVGLDPKTLNSAFVNLADHTPDGDGKMLVMDVDAQIGKVVYETEVDVVQGRNYFFSAWFANINTSFTNSPRLSFAIEGITLGETVFVDSVSHNWTQFNTNWTALSTGKIKISIKNLRNEPSGNDLALDDVSFKAGCDGITDLSALGKASALPKTVYTCNENFTPYVLDTKLNNSGYAFNWYKDAASEKLGIVMDDAKNAGTSTATLGITTAPGNGTKYYVCYDSLGDKLTCARLDSVTFLSNFKFDIPNQTVCPPINVVLDPAMTTTNITSWKYERISPTPIATVGSGTGLVLPLSVSDAGTYRLTIVHNNGSCTAAPDNIVIDTLVAAFNGAINASCSGGTATGTVDLVPNITGTSKVTIIGGLANVSWFKTSTGSSPEYGPFKSVDAKGTTSATNLVKTNPACPQGGLFLQDNNSFATTLGSTTLCNTTSSSTQFSGMKYMKIKLTAPATITSINASVKTYNAADALILSVEVYKNNPTGQYYSSCNCQGDGPAAAVFKTGTVNTITPGTTPKDQQIVANIALDTGTYWIRINNTGQGGEVTNSTCSKTYPYSDAKSVITAGGLLDKGGNKLVAESGELYNLKFQVGNPTSCGRVWVCATCALPVEYTYFNVYPTGDQNVLITWGTAHESKNRVFVVEASSDGVNFTAVAEVGGSHNSHLQKDYSVQQSMIGERQYYRIKQVDHDGKFTYTPVRFVSLNGSDAIGEVYPQPVKHGEVLHVKINGLIDTQLTLKLQSISGFDISEQTVAIGENTEAITFNTAGLTAGVYLLLISNTDFAKTIRVVVE